MPVQDLCESLIISYRINEGRGLISRPCRPRPQTGPGYWSQEFTVLYNLTILSPRN